MPNAVLTEMVSTTVSRLRSSIDEPLPTCTHVMRGAERTICVAHPDAIRCDECQVEHLGTHRPVFCNGCGADDRSLDLSAPVRVDHDFPVVVVHETAMAEATFWAGHVIFTGTFFCRPCGTPAA